MAGLGEENRWTLRFLGATDPEREEWGKEEHTIGCGKKGRQGIYLIVWPWQFLI